MSLMKENITPEMLKDLIFLSENISDKYGEAILYALVGMYGKEVAYTCLSMALTFFTMGYFEHQKLVEDVSSELFQSKNGGLDGN